MPIAKSPVATATSLAPPVLSDSPISKPRSSKRASPFYDEAIQTKRPRTRSFTAGLATPPSSPPSGPAPEYRKRAYNRKRGSQARLDPLDLYLLCPPEVSSGTIFTEKEAQYIESFDKNPINEKNFEVFKSSLAGYGLRAKKNLKKGTFVGRYTGELISKLQSDEVEAFYKSHNMNQCFLWSLYGGEVVDATNVGNKTRFINHSCEPNCRSTESGEILRIYTNQHIKKGTELTIGYDFAPEPQDQRVPCKCNSSKCKGFLN